MDPQYNLFDQPQKDSCVFVYNDHESGKNALFDTKRIVCYVHKSAKRVDLKSLNAEEKLKAKKDILDYIDLIHNNGICLDSFTERDVFISFISGRYFLSNYRRCHSEDGILFPHMDYLNGESSDMYEEINSVDMMFS
jgi:hypothetical protein